MLINMDQNARIERGEVPATTTKTATGDARPLHTNDCVRQRAKFGARSASGDVCSCGADAGLREHWQISGYVPSTRSDGQRVVRVTAPHPDGGGQDVAEMLESVAPKAVAAFNSHASLVAALEQVRNVLYPDDAATEHAIHLIDEALRQAREGL